MTTISSGLDLDKLGITSSTKAADAAQKKRDTLDQSDFLRLLTTQLKNQDPLKPIDNEAFVAQMAQFSSVAGISEMNESLKSMTSLMEGGRIGTATGFVGKYVLVPGKVAMPDADGAIYGALDLPSSATNLLVTVKNASGATVRTLDLGSADEGTTEFGWDGKDASGQAVPGGPFTIEATGLVGGKQEKLATAVYGRVRTVNLPTNGSAMTLEVDGVGDVAFDSVRKVTG